jgi:hypothetical protein
MSVLRSVGRCIYCDATGVPLSKEHIVPVALGGSDVLLDAVCRTCQPKINDGFESRLLRSSLLAFRSALGLPTRNHARRPITMPVDVNRGGIWTTEELEVDGLPAQVSWPVMKAPAFLEGRDAIGITFRSFRTIALNRTARSESRPSRASRPRLRLSSATSPGESRSDRQLRSPEATRTPTHNPKKTSRSSSRVGSRSTRRRSTRPVSGSALASRFATVETRRRSHRTPAFASCSPCYASQTTPTTSWHGELLCT